MPAAATKADLEAVSVKEFAKLTALIDGLAEDVARAPDAEGWSIKDVLAHRTHWIHLTLRWARAGRAGETPQIPAPGYKWSDLKRYNLELRARQDALDWTDVQQGLADAHRTLMAEIAALDEAALYGGPMPGGSNHWPTGRWYEACGASHYRSAAKFVRAQIRRLAPTKKTPSKRA